jgi:uncharacterized membrane protein
MEGLDVIVLEVDLDEGLPVVFALVHVDAVEHVAREVEILQRERRKVARDVARPVEQQAVPVLERRAAEIDARLVGKVRRAEELALEVVRPAWIGQTMFCALPLPLSMMACRCRQTFESSSTPLALRTSVCALSRAASTW